MNRYKSSFSQKRFVLMVMALAIGLLSVSWAVAGEVKRITVPYAAVDLHPGIKSIKITCKTTNFATVTIPKPGDQSLTRTVSTIVPVTGSTNRGARGKVTLNLIRPVQATIIECFASTISLSGKESSGFKMHDMSVMTVKAGL